MTEWEVVGVIVTLVSLGGVVATVTSKLVKAITELTTTVKILNETNSRDHDDIKDSIEKEVGLAHEAHMKYEKVLDCHDKKLAEHETRIAVLERT